MDVLLEENPDPVHIQAWGGGNTGASIWSKIIDLQNATTEKVSWIAPKVNFAETIHIILEVSDNGSPSLKAYQRFVITVMAE